MPVNSLNAIEEMRKARTRFVDAVRRALDAIRGRCVLIFCVEGAHRSAYMTAGILLGATQKQPGEVQAFLKSIREITDLDTGRSDYHASGAASLRHYRVEWHSVTHRAGLTAQLPDVASYQAILQMARAKVTSERSSRFYGSIEGCNDIQISFKNQVSTSTLGLVDDLVVDPKVVQLCSGIIDCSSLASRFRCLR